MLVRNLIGVLACLVLTGLCATVSSTKLCAEEKTPPPPPSTGAKPDVMRLFSFEIEEEKAKLNSKELEGWLVGKLYTGRIKGGWRIKDHMDEIRLPDDWKGDVTLYKANGSYDMPFMNLYAKGTTEGKYAKMYSPPTGGSEITDWKYIVGYTSGKPSGLMGQPSPEGYHEILDWFFQRYTSFFGCEKKDSRLDWSGYEVLRMDFIAEGSPAIVGVRAFDSSGPKIPAHYLGVRTKLAIYELEVEKQVTIEFPLADLCKAAELDMSKMMGFVLRLNGYKGECRLYMDNFRLVKKDAMASDLKCPLLKMQGEIGPYGRTVTTKFMVERDATKMEKKISPITERVGPITILDEKASYSSFGGPLGGGGWTYSQSLRRGLSAYDNDRLCLVYGVIGKGEFQKDSFRGTASFDGGKTWGGLKQGAKDPVTLNWGKDWRMTTSSDLSGDIYSIGIENCSSYREGYDIVFRRLAFIGDGWAFDRQNIVCQTMRKCPCTIRAWKLPSGRIWEVWTDGWNGKVAKCSDDDGLTWEPCKDASLPAPRPFYEPKLDDLKKPMKERPAPPKEILPFPGISVAGALLVPFKDGIAALSDNDSKWQACPDGKNWGAEEKLPFCPIDATTLGTDQICMVRGGVFVDRPPDKRGKLEVAIYKGGQWASTVLDADGNVGDATITVSGNTIFVLYVKAINDGPYTAKKKATKTGSDAKSDAETKTDSVPAPAADDKIVNEIRLISCKDGKWGNSELIATENFLVCRVGSPVICPPSYAAFIWDSRCFKEYKTTPLRFIKIPNN